MPDSIVVKFPSGHTVRLGTRNSGAPAAGLHAISPQAVVVDHLIEQTGETFDRAMGALGDIVARLEATVGALEHRPDAVEIEFAASLKGDVDLWVVSGAGDADFLTFLSLEQPHHPALHPQAEPLTLLPMPEADLALLLAFDASASVTYEEFTLIAGGIAEALRDPEIAQGLTSGHSSLCALLVFSGSRAQETMIPWTRLVTLDDIAAFAQAVDDIPRLVQPGLTAIGSALLAANRLLADVSTPRRILDLAADGASNDGPEPAAIRDRMASRGITINGLCVLHEEPDLVDTFTRDVIGGPGCFALPCPDYARFADAMRRKLTREIA